MDIMIISYLLTYLPTPSKCSLFTTIQIFISLFSYYVYLNYPPTYLPTYLPDSLTSGGAMSLYTGLQYDDPNPLGMMI